MLARVGLEKFGSRKISTLSGGQKQRVAVARAMIKKPKILLADEPTGALDSETGANLFQLLKELSRETLVVVVSHDLDFAQKYGDRIIELSDGKVINDSRNAEEESEKATTIMSEKRKSLTIGKAIKLGLKGVKKNPVRFSISMILCAIALVLFGVGQMMSQYDHVRVLSRTLMTYDNEVILNNKEYTYFSPTEMENIVARYPTIRFKPIYDSLYGVRDYNDIDLHNDWYGDLPGLYYSVGVNTFCEINESEMKQFGYEIVAGRLPMQDGEVAIPLYLYEKLAEVTNRDLYEEYHVPYVKNYNDLLGKALNGNSGTLIVVGIVDTKIDAKYSPLKNFTYDDYSVEKEKAMRHLVEYFRDMARDSTQFCAYLPEGYFNRHLSSGLRYINVSAIHVPAVQNQLEILRDYGVAGAPVQYWPIQHFISYDDITDADRGLIYTPGFDETNDLGTDEAIVTFELLCLGDHQIDQLYKEKSRELIREYVKEHLDSLLHNSQFMADYEDEKKQAEGLYYIDPEIFYKTINSEVTDYVKKDFIDFCRYIPCGNYVYRLGCLRKSD